MHATAELFSSQDGLATTLQLNDAGVSRKVIAARVRTGEWQRLDRRVIGVASMPTTWRRRVRAASLAAGDHAAVSGETAARLHGFDGFDRAPEIHVTTFGRHHHTPPTGTHIHRSRAIDVGTCIDVNGMLVVGRPVALVQVAASHGRDRAGQALDGMLRKGDHPLWIRQVAASLARPGLSGPRTVLSLLDERVDGALPTSWFQRLAERVVATRGLDMVDEHPVRRDDGTLLACLDLAIPAMRIGIECQSWYWHSTPGARAADARRRRLLRVLGWEIVDVWWNDLDRADEVAEEIVYLITRSAA